MENSVEKNKTENKERKVIFLDIDGVLQPDTQYRFEHDLDETQRMLSKKYNNEEFVTLLDKYDVCAVYYDWSREAVNNLKELLETTSAEIVISSDWKVGKTLHQLKLLFSLYDLDRYIIDKTQDMRYYREKEINAYLKNHKDITSYVILDDMWYIKEHFLNNMVCTRAQFFLDYSAMQEAKRVLEIGAWWNDDYEKKLKKVTTPDGVIHDYFENVIFLNIERNEREIFSNSLSYIKRFYRVEYVCSSFEKAVREKRRDEYVKDSKKWYEQERGEAKANYISQMIWPDSVSGVVSYKEGESPYIKIKSWLKKRPYVKNFIIMNSQDNVRWKEMRDHVVDITKRELDELEIKRDSYEERREKLPLFVSKILGKMGLKENV